MTTGQKYNKNKTKLTLENPGPVFTGLQMVYTQNYVTGFVLLSLLNKTIKIIVVVDYKKVNSSSL